MQRDVGVGVCVGVCVGVGVGVGVGLGVGATSISYNPMSVPIF